MPLNRQPGPAYLRLTHHPYIVIVDGRECRRFSNLAIALETAEGLIAGQRQNMPAQWLVVGPHGRRWTRDMMETAG